MTPSNRGLKVRTSVKAGQIAGNHNQTMAPAFGVKSNVKAGGLMTNHNQTVAGGLRLKSSVKAGALNAY
jgi:hypothetical protein